MTSQELIDHTNQLTSRTGVRSSIVERVKQEISEGRYDTPEKLAAAQDCIEEAIAESLMS